MRQYELIVRWERARHSTGDRIAEVLQQARDDGAPATSVYRRDDGSWVSMYDLTAGERTKIGLVED